MSPAPRILLSLVLLLTLALPAGAAVRPRILIIFDTSGSMHATGDGSELCGGVGKNSRMWQLKQAFFEVLQGMGAQEVDFALMTFPMKVDPTRTPKCYNQCYDASGYSMCSGHYYLDDAQDSEYSNSSAPQGGGGNQMNGCKISTHNPSVVQSGNCGDASNPCSSWYANFKKEMLWVPFAGSTPEKMMLYFDGKEDAGSVSVLQNPEVRAGNWWYTPLGKSLYYAHGYFHKEVSPSIPSYEKPCVKQVVALFTDGNETCNFLTNDAFYPTKWAKNLHDNLGVTVHTVAIDVGSATLSSIASNGGGVYYQVGGNTAALKAAFLDIIAKSLPPTETCNDKDDDCDAQADEDFPLKGQPCDNGKLGKCFATGTYVCSTDGSGVTCNANGPAATTEVCNTIDDDCNGAIDDVKKTCSSDTDCASLGQASCVAGNCACVLCVPQPEICNGKDDDCDTKVDEDFVSQPCGLDLGKCKPGNTKCENGKIICDGSIAGGTEVCNGEDDDCDGIRDGMSRSCYEFNSGCTEDAQQGWVCKGFCRPGMQTCTAQQSGGNWSGVWGNCIGQVGPSKETCNGQDDDCDGDVDEDAECPAGTKCVNGMCVSECGTGEFSCPKGFLCKDGWCVKDPCDPVQCESTGGVCKGGECINVCANVTCTGKYETCVKGACVDQSCYNPQNPCPAGKTCIDGKCQADPCADVTCGGDEFCAKGKCVRLCDTVACPDGQVCRLVDGTARCVADPCGGKLCNPPYVCKNGDCIEDPCNVVGCDSGEVCDDGTCVPDPCEAVTCPQHFTCKMGMCVAGEDTTTRRLLATGAGGMACTYGGGGAGGSAGHPGALLLTLLLGLGLTALRRRD